LKNTDLQPKPGAALMLEDYFPYKVCINLDRRSDRWRRISTRFAAHGISGILRFPAIDGSQLEIPAHWSEFPGAYGCLRSHVAVVENARAAGARSVLVFEDDAVLDPDFNSKFPAYVSQLPQDWDMLMLGAIHGQEPRKVTSNIGRVTLSLSTFAYALKETIYDRFIDYNNKASIAVDDNNTVLQKEFNCYCFQPNLAWVEEDYSDIRQETQSHWYVRESLVLWGPQMQRVLNDTVLVISHTGDDPGAARNIHFAVKHYMEKMPGISAIVVEQNPKPHLRAGDLSANCAYRFLKTTDGWRRGTAFNTGFNVYEASKELFIFCDSNIFIEPIDLKPNLLMCARHDFATSFRSLYTLTEEDSLRCIAGDFRWSSMAVSKPSEKPSLCTSCCIFSKKGMRMAGPWSESGDEADEQMSRQVRTALPSYYGSPNRARLLWSR